MMIAAAFFWCIHLWNVLLLILLLLLIINLVGCRHLRLLTFTNMSSPLFPLMRNSVVLSVQSWECCEGVRRRKCSARTPSF